MTVTVSEHYVPGCEECCAAVERIIRSAIRDYSVTKVSLTPGHRHNHEVEKALRLPKAAEPTPLPPGGELFDGTSGGRSADAPNGFDNAVEA